MRKRKGELDFIRDCVGIASSLEGQSSCRCRANTSNSSDYAKRIHNVCVIAILRSYCR
jgi:hypothetical protein